MRRQGIRPFRIRDAVVLVAATGFGLAGCRFWLWATRTNLGELLPAGDRSVLFGLWAAAVWAIPLASIMLLGWTVGVLLLRVVTDRPRRRRLWCQPGFLACVAAVFAFAWKSVGIGFLIAAEILTARPGQLSNIDYGAVAGELALLLLSDQMAPIPQANTGAAVLLVWLVAWAGGRCRPEPSWIDRSGRALGVLWMCVSALASFGRFLG